MCRFKRCSSNRKIYQWEFQYIICVGSRNINSCFSKIVIEFQYIICVGSSGRPLALFTSIWISIHHMCRFKHENISILKREWRISIHHMCRFKKDFSWMFDCYKGFQYIICVGSSRKSNRKVCWKQAISIHHMCRFKISFLCVKISTCRISIHHMCRFKLKTSLMMS